MRLALEVLSWWLVLTLLWIGSLNSVSLPDLVAAVACGFACALVAVAARRAIGVDWRPRRHWLRWVAAVPVSIVTDTVRVFRSLPSGQGAIRRVRISDSDVGSRAVATAVFSATPASVVTGSIEEEARLDVHVVPDRAPGLARTVRR